MAPHPDNSNSSGATVAMIAAVVIGVLILGILAMVTLGFLFFFTVRDSVVYEMTTDPVEVVERLPIEAAASDETPMDEETGGAKPDTPLATEPPGDGGRADVPAPETSRESAIIPPTETPAPPIESPRKSLADLTPFEKIDVRLGDAPLVRSVRVGGQSHPSAIWAQPQADLGTCQISYPVQQAYARLTGMAAVADASGDDAAVVPKGTFHIYADGNLLWNSGLIEGHGISKPFDLDIAGVRLVALVVESDASSAASPFAWVNLQLVPASGAVSP